MVFTDQIASTAPSANGRASAAPSTMDTFERLGLMSRRKPVIFRMKGVGSTATTLAPDAAALMTPGPIPAPMSTTVSPDWGLMKSTVASFTTDRHMRGAILR